MSTAATAAVWKARGLDTGERVVLLRLADVAHPDGSNAYLGVGTVAEDCEVDRRTVQRILRRLEERGYIALQHPARPGGPGRPGRPATYRLCLTGLASVAEPVDAEGGVLPPSGAATGRQQGGNRAAPTPPDPDPEPDPSPLDDPRVREAMRALHRRIQQDVMGGADAPPSRWGEVEIARVVALAADPTVIAAVIERVVLAMRPTAGARAKGLPYGLGTLRGAIEDLEANGGRIERGGAGGARGDRGGRGGRGGAVRGGGPGARPGGQRGGAGADAGAGDRPAPPPRRASDRAAHHYQQPID